MAKQDCAHPDCDCVIQDNSGVTQGNDTYCSSYCAKAGPSSQSKECECGHADCN